MKKLVNAGLTSGEEFAIQLMRGEVFYSPAIDGVTWSYRFSKNHQFVTAASNSMHFKAFFPLGIDALANMMMERDLTLAELIKIKPRLCKVSDVDYIDGSAFITVIKAVNANGKYLDSNMMPWRFAELLTDEEIKQFLCDPGVKKPCSGCYSPITPNDSPHQP